MVEAAPALIEVEVVYALPRRAQCFPVRVPRGSTVEMAVRASGILDAVPELAGQQLDTGIFGRCCDPGDAVREGDRIEVYRPLVLDPKESRRRRAAAPG